MPHRPRRSVILFSVLLPLLTVHLAAQDSPLPRTFRLNPTDGMIDIRGNHGFPTDKQLLGRVSREVEGKGAVLVGFKVSTRRGAFNPIVIGLQPIYRRHDQEIYGKALGTTLIADHLFVARPGYAVGAIRSRAGLTIDAFQLVYMKIKKDRLDPNDSYESAIAAEPKKIGNASASTEGYLPVGVHATINDKDWIVGIGMVVKPR